MAAAGLTIEEELARACQLGEEKKVQKFLRNAEIDIDKLVKSPKEDDPGFTLLMMAVSRGHEAVVKMLLSHKASVNAPNADGATALHMVCRPAPEHTSHAKHTSRALYEFPHVPLCPSVPCRLLPRATPRSSRS